MILRILNKDVPLRNLLFVIGEGTLIYIAILLAAYIRFGSLQDSFLSLNILSKAMLIMLVCQLSLYFNDLYNLKVTDTYLELGLRLTRAIGIASIALAIIYYCIPSLSHRQLHTTHGEGSQRTEHCRHCGLVYLMPKKYIRDASAAPSVLACSLSNSASSFSSA